jgi:hypothetical protein
VADQTTDPPHIVCDFISSLPVTIKPLIVPLIWIYAVRLLMKRDQDIEAEIRDLLLRSGRTFGFGMLLCTVAAIDHILNTAVTNATEREDVLKELAPSNPYFQQAALQAPLNTRHFDAAWKQWTSLRSGPLAPEMIQDYERRLRTAPRGQ